MTDAAPAPAKSPFPPQGFSVTRHVPHVWQPRVGEVLQGWVCDPRPDCIGILVTAHAPGALTDHGPVEVARVVHVQKDERMGYLENTLVEHEAEIEGKKRTVTYTHEAAIFCESIALGNRPAFAVALRLEPPLPMAEALTRTLAIREASKAPQASPAPAPAQASAPEPAANAGAAPQASPPTPPTPPAAPVVSDLAAAVPPVTSS